MVWPATTERVLSEPSDGEAMDPFSDDTPLDIESCDLENPESCESCQ